MKTLEPGSKVPDFTVVDQDGNAITNTDLKGEKYIVFFYPKASTPGCTAEACNLRDHYKTLTQKGYRLLGVSADSQKRQTNFRNKYDFPFPLIADEDKTLINAFGVWGPKKFMGKSYEGIHRMTFLVNEKGVVEHVVQKVKTKAHAAQLLELMNSD